MRAIISGRFSRRLSPVPIAVSLAIYDSFYSTSSALYGLIPLPFPNETAPNHGHAMCVVGLMDKDYPKNPFDIDYMIVCNSCGPIWAAASLAKAGDALIPAAYFDPREYVWEAYINLCPV